MNTPFLLARKIKFFFFLFFTLSFQLMSPVKISAHLTEKLVELADGGGAIVSDNCPDQSVSKTVTVFFPNKCS